jgi:hypothetical protein
MAKVKTTIEIKFDVAKTIYALTMLLMLIFK